MRILSNLDCKVKVMVAVKGWDTRVRFRGIDKSFVYASGYSVGLILVLVLGLRVSVRIG